MEERKGRKKRAEHWKDREERRREWKERWRRRAKKIERKEWGMRRGRKEEGRKVKENIKGRR
jgi:hypothetical protein